MVLKILTLFGFGGKSLDKILALLTKLDAELEAYEAAEAVKVAKLTDTISSAEAEKAEKEAAIERALRVRAKVGELVA